MGPRSRWVISALAGSLVLGGAHALAVRAPSTQLPTEITQIRFNSGQNVVPYFEGWIRNPDGSADLVFGYFNRNWQEELAIPAGPNNKVDPGGPDAGQPTYFLPRRQRFVFRVRVPADFGKRELTWAITANGRTEKAYGNLLPAQEISERVIMTTGNFNPGHDDPNIAPSITIASDVIQAASLASAVTLTALVTDDGLPKPRPVSTTPRPSTAGAFGAQVNSSGRGRPRGLTVSWLQYGGPAKVTFEHEGPIVVTNGRAVTTARFTAPGTYKLIATANDGELSTRTELTIVVAP